MTTTHAHPQPLLDALTQYGAAALLALITLSVPLQIVLAFSGAPVFALTGLFTLAFAPFLLMLLAATPAVTVGPDGLIVQPKLGKAQAVAWADIAAIKPYPLLPPPDAELSRRYLAGRSRYRPAEGLMLLIPRLPAQYRVAGLLAGEGFTPVIAVTTRTHDRYDLLVKKIRAYAEDAV